MSDIDQRGRPRVVVTGVGVKTPAGNDVASFWEQLCAGRASARRIESFDPADLSITFAGEVRDFDAAEYFGPKEARRQDRVTQLGFGAAADALGDAGELGADPSRCAVIIATGVGGLHTLEENERIYFEKGPSRVSPFFVPMMMPNATAGVVAMQLGWTGPNLCVATACAAGAHAIGEGVRLIRDGTADVVMAGGTEAAVTPLTIAAFARMGALSTRNDAPERASRPFDADRDGFVIGEGAGCVVLEPLERARARGATIYGEVAGYGRNADAYHITAPSPGGAGAAVCMQLALDDAAVEPSAIGHVNAHGTSTPLNDAAEAEAVRKVFGDSAPVVTSTKGVTGHLIGAAGAVEAVTLALTLKDGVLPPTINLTYPDPECDLDYVPNSARDFPVRTAISTSFGFGGQNAALVMRRFSG